MALRKAHEKIDINVEPFLSIMAIVLKLISLILVVIVMRIAMNPTGLFVPMLPGIWHGKGTNTDIKVPSYLDCHEDHVLIYPGATRVSGAELERPGNPLENLLNRIQANRGKEYVIVMARPDSVTVYRRVRNLISKRPIEVGYDAVDENYRVDWDAAVENDPLRRR
jgi:hypothetical protein